MWPIDNKHSSQLRYQRTNKTVVMCMLVAQVGSSRRGSRAKTVANQHESETLAQAFFTKMSNPGAVYAQYSIVYTYTAYYTAYLHQVCTSLSLRLEHAQSSSALTSALYTAVYSL
jgi:hypothetical protein